MKNLFTFLSLFVLIGMSASVFAQSTGTNPAPGATHTYSVTDNGNSYTWSVTKGDLTTSAASDATITGSGASVNIKWASTVTADDWYYVHVIEDDGTCKNEKVLPVQITASQFNLAIAASKETQCYDGDVSISLDGNEPKYDHGNTTISFVVSPTGLSSSYSGYTFDISLALSQVGVSQTNATVSSNASISGNTVSVADNNAVTITYTVDNTNEYDNSTDAAGTAADYTATATISNGVSSNGVSDNTSGTYSDATNVARPHTTKITTN